MGRKKKTVDINETVIPTPTIAAKSINVEEQQTIGYKGEVSVKVARGNKIINTRTLHNSGMPSLFKFLANCLAGIYSKNSRPCKIRLFYLTHDNGITPSAFNWKELFESNNAPDPASPYIIYDAVPKVRVKQLSEGPGCIYSTTYHFRIPFSYLTKDYVNMAGLYSNNVIDDSECSAYYLFAEDNEWEDLSLGDIDGNYSLIID